MRRKQREELIQQLKDQVRLLEDGIILLDTENSSKHRERAKAAAEQDAKVLELFDMKLRSLSTSAAAQPAAGMVVAVQIKAVALPEAQPTSLAELEVARRQIQVLQELLKAAASKVLAARRAGGDCHLP